MKKENNYLKNTLILSLGKFATQFISIILLPLFTRYLSTSDYGLVDLIQTYISLFIPIFLLCLDTAIFRFLIEKRNDKAYINTVITNSYIFLIFQIIIITFFAIVLKLVLNFNYFVLTIINLYALMLSNMLFQTCRGIGKNKEYSVATIIIAIFNLILNFILIVFFNFGADSILIASIIGNIFASIYMSKKISLIQRVKKSLIDKRVLKEMLSYSLPMIPNTLSWWIINVSDRTILSFFLTSAANGVYTISCKFSNIVNSIFSIFIMSWQESATIHINDTDKEKYFSRNINDTMSFFTSLIIICLLLIPLIFNVVIGQNYYEAYNYIPILLISCIFSIFTSLVGGIYVAKKMTKEVAKTSLLSALINAVINLAFIKFIGIYAACISTLISYILMAIYRYFDIKKYVLISFDVKKTFILFLLLVFSCFLYYLKNAFFSIIALLISTLMLIYLNLEFLKDFLFIILKRIKR